MFAQIFNLNVLITVRNEVAKVVFTRVCDSVHRGVLSQHALQVVSQHALQRGGCLLPGGSALGGLPALGVCAPGGSAPGGPAPGRSAPRGVPALAEGVCSQGRCLLWGVPALGGYCCGRYASYWNAFLFCKMFVVFRHCTRQRLRRISHCKFNTRVPENKITQTYIKENLP